MLYNLMLEQGQGLEQEQGREELSPTPMLHTLQSYKVIFQLETEARFPEDNPDSILGRRYTFKLPDYVLDDPRIQNFVEQFLAQDESRDLLLLQALKQSPNYEQIKERATAWNNAVTRLTNNHYHLTIATSFQDAANGMERLCNLIQASVQNPNTIVNRQVASRLHRVMGFIVSGSKNEVESQEKALFLLLWLRNAMAAGLTEANKHLAILHPGNARSTAAIAITRLWSLPSKAEVENARMEEVHKDLMGLLLGTVEQYLKRDFPCTHTEVHTLCLMVALLKDVNETMRFSPKLPELESDQGSVFWTLKLLAFLDTVDTYRRTMDLLKGDEQALPELESNLSVGFLAPKPLQVEAHGEKNLKKWHIAVPKGFADVFNPFLFQGTLTRDSARGVFPDRAMCLVLNHPRNFMVPFLMHQQEENPLAVSLVFPNTKKASIAIAQLYGFTPVSPTSKLSDMQEAFFTLRNPNNREFASSLFAHSEMREILSMMLAVPASATTLFSTSQDSVYNLVTHKEQKQKQEKEKWLPDNVFTLFNFMLSFNQDYLEDYLFKQ